MLMKERLKSKYLLTPKVERLSISHLKRIPMESPEMIGGMENPTHSEYQMELGRISL